MARQFKLSDLPKRLAANKVPHQAKDDVFPAADVLGGKYVWKRLPTTKMEVHEAILKEFRSARSTT